MSDFRTVLEASGMRPRDVAADGRWRRCATDDKPKKRNGAYKLSVDGQRGWWRNWATDLEMNEWQGDDVRSASRRVVDEERLQRQRELDRARTLSAIRGARGYWADSGPPACLHPYVAGKGLSMLGCAGLRVQGDLLVVPVIAQSMLSVQTISPDGEKRFWPGAPVKGGAFVLDRARPAVTCFVEGLATGLAVYQSVPQARVVVAFDAGNLLPVIQRLKPSGSVVIAADNDHRTFAVRGVNPGLDKARNAAELIDCGVAYPTGIEGSDWADALKEWGVGAGRRIERQVLAEARFVMT